MAPLRYHFAASGAVVRCRASVRRCPYFSFEQPAAEEFAAGKASAAKYRMANADRMRAFRFSRATVQAFTEGDCWRLAVALHELTGWPLHAIAYTKQDHLPQAGRSFAHVFVLDPAGHAVDIEGVHRLGSAYLRRYAMLPGWREDLGEANHYAVLDAQAYLHHARRSQAHIEYPELDPANYAQRVLGQWRRSEN